MAGIMQKEARRATSYTSVALNHVAQVIPLTMTAGATATGSIQMPAGCVLSSIRADTATAFSGTPTAINLRVGTAAAGQQVVADVDVKGQGRVLTTIVSTFDAITGATTYFFQLAASGGTNPAGTVNVLVGYYTPAP